jgi:hypothetical protein
LGLSGHVRFLVDTGADFTLIHPTSMTILGVQPKKHFRDAGLNESHGIGGRTKLYLEPCNLTFAHQNGTMDQIALTLRFASPTRVNAHYPSLLGRDVLSYYRLTFEQASNLVMLETP